MGETETERHGARKGETAGGLRGEAETETGREGRGRAAENTMQGKQETIRQVRERQRQMAGARGRKQT